MKLHRFYIGGVHDKWGKIKLEHSFWVHDKQLLNQWLSALQLKVGERLVLFDDNEERLYKITKIEDPYSVQLELVTEEERVLPDKHIYLFWPLLDDDKNDYILQKGTELGVRNFIPILLDKTVKTDFDIERTKRTIIEAVEQCGRTDIPDVREPISLNETIKEYGELPLFIYKKGEENVDISKLDKFGILISPEGVWSDKDRQIFVDNDLSYLDMPDYTSLASNLTKSNNP
jgi:16S rRNA (uracil1498-N3)-methyltransferase